MLECKVYVFDLKDLLKNMEVLMGGIWPLEIADVTNERISLHQKCL